jgi:hypothetical protein
MQLTTGTFKRIALLSILDLLREMRISQIRKTVKSDNEFVQKEPAYLPRYYTVHALYAEIKIAREKLITEFPELEDFSNDLQFVINEIKKSGTSAKELLKAYHVLVTIQDDWLNTLSPTSLSSFVVTANEAYVIIHRISNRLCMRGNLETTGFLQEICTLMELLRFEKRKPTNDEFIAIKVAHVLVLEARQIDYPYRSWGTSGFRDIQTYMSVTDPGEGHINGTCSDISLMKGVIVHIEHLERGNEQDREKVEPYRIPAIGTVAKVRLHVASDAPVSSYIGRPVFESEQFKPSLLKAVNTISSACTAMFMDGLAECKIAIEGMTAIEAIEFMQCMVGAVRRDKYSQCLSAAFNINTPILDDREETQRHHNGPVWVTDRFEIGLLGIELTKAGGFDKVTWDGTGNHYPSACILEQISHQQAVQLVHRAHEVGLLTYFSAGFRFHHLPKAIYTGVDGVGVGGAQILRYMDKTTGFHGPFKPENIKEILRIRDEAENDWLGQAAVLLCRMDRMFFEGSITPQDEQKRLELFNAVSSQDREQCIKLLNALSHIRTMPPDQDHPLIEWGKRLLNTEDQNPLIASTKSLQDWTAFLQTIKNGVEANDISLLADELGVGNHIPAMPFLFPVASAPPEADSLSVLSQVA